MTVNPPAERADPIECRTARLFTRTYETDAVTVSATGEIDAANVVAFEQCIRRAERPNKRLVIDLGELKFLGVQAGSALAALYDDLELRHTECGVVTSAAVWRTLRLCDPAGVIRTAGSVDAALQVLRRETTPVAS
ncbi:STAS domain-containing protein [Mycolicibacterium confluentis]|uniref:Uncharacterized protein n=1 Tax=Mycolicibacterium confluentis TaxID=28047 RepID=A0A7I7Y4J2_9MYCO|nr:STAS domain-containing protein [Mycolicibacterium confluentis]MCV7318124.1 STAS domain-containing protein [Mycolicibacterium confluentis]ORV31215.1 hypothetical protein AWB99_12435 [Mycolicibacterium confluentis]BBZ36033.1 hypothetical protein MCNF_46380 [Mycolicibacterium confluentis]